MRFPTYEKWGEKVAEQVIDVYLINGRTIREWIEILSDELTMLDKIRAEIEGLTYYWCEVNPKSVIDDALQIIDKYREGEQE